MSARRPSIPSVAWRPGPGEPAGPWLCVAVLRRVCLCRGCRGSSDDTLPPRWKRAGFLCRGHPLTTACCQKRRVKGTSSQICQRFFEPSPAFSPGAVSSPWRSGARKNRQENERRGPARTLGAGLQPSHPFQGPTSVLRYNPFPDSQRAQNLYRADQILNTLQATCRRTVWNGTSCQSQALSVQR